jgi:ectoine hydroxylase-related dioxygenase (phytanoyl-CoA dioxygenase family)
MSEFQLNRESLESRDVASDRASVAQRMEFYRDLMPSASPAIIVQERAGKTAPSEAVTPEVTAQELTVEFMRTAMAEHGALIVRNMFSQTETDTLIEAIDRVLAACASPREVRIKLASTYFNPPDNLVSIMPNKVEELAHLRMFNSTAGAAMCVEAPSVAEALLELYDAHGLKQLIGEYFGESPCLSVKKWVLRRNTPTRDEAGWHQDGAFMGTNINSINMWVPLTKCGGETGAPGMDVVPQRLYKIASAEGATFDWSVSDAHVRSGAFNGPPVAPVFNAGDAFFFDHFYLHRTQSRTDFTQLRYAVESWFFGASTFPKEQIPVAW